MMKLHNTEKSICDPLARCIIQLLDVVSLPIFGWKPDYKLISFEQIFLDCPLSRVFPLKAERSSISLPPAWDPCCKGITEILQGSVRHLHSVFRQFTLQHSRQGQRSSNPILPTRLVFLQRREMRNHSGTFPIITLGTIMSAPRSLGQENWKFKFFLSFVLNLQSALATLDLLSEQSQKS